MDAQPRSSGSGSSQPSQPFSHLAVLTFHSKWHQDRTCTIQSSDDLAWEVGRYLCADLPTTDAYATLRTYRVKNHGPAAGTRLEVTDAETDL